jgi:hypothetical protein
VNKKNTIFLIFFCSIYLRDFRSDCLRDFRGDRLGLREDFLVFRDFLGFDFRRPNLVCVLCVRLGLPNTLAPDWRMLLN